MQDESRIGYRIQIKILLTMSELLGLVNQTFLNGINLLVGTLFFCVGVNLGVFYFPVNMLSFSKSFCFG